MKIKHTAFEVYFNHSTASMHFKTKLLLSHLDTHKNNKICGHLGRSHYPFSSTKIISLNITTNALSSSSIAHKTIFGRPFLDAHTTGIIHVWGNLHIIEPNSWKESRWARHEINEHSHICRHRNTKIYTHSQKLKIA